MGLSPTGIGPDFYQSHGKSQGLQIPITESHKIIGSENANIYKRHRKR